MQNIKDDLDISVIVPVYNVEEYLPMCLESIQNQTFTKYEVILVDDGSTDSSGIICDDVCREDERFQVIHKKNGGLMSAWMTGVQQATGKYICFVDSDDWVGERMLEIYFEKIEKFQVDIVIGGFYKVVGDKKYPSNNVIDEGLYREHQLYTEIFPKLINAGGFQKRGISISRWGKLIKKDIILNNIKYCNPQISFSEDFNIMFPVLLDCKSLYIVRDVSSFYFYRMNPDSILHKYNEKMYLQVGLLYPILDTVTEEKGFDMFEYQLQADYLAALVQCYKNELMNPKGFRKAIRNICKISNDKKIHNIIKSVDWKRYGILNKTIIFALNYNNAFTTVAITYLLYILKKLKRYQLKSAVRKQSRSSQV